jgi:hypothetical protein
MRANFGDLSGICDLHRRAKREFPFNPVKLHALTKSNPLSPHHRFVIAWHSPGGAVETGLRGCPSEKKARTLACRVESDTFSGPVWNRNSQNYADFEQFPEQSSRISPQPRLCGGEIGIRTFVTLCVWR